LVDQPNEDRSTPDLAENRLGDRRFRSRRTQLQRYYKVTEKVDLAGLEPRDVAALGFPAQLVLLKTVAHSLKILHDLHIVHSDLKSSNVMIKRTELGYTIKLIDFDSSYIVGNPPPPEEIVGTMNYYSPELISYIQASAPAVVLTEASDIFALGLIYAEYLTGALPPFDPTHHEPPSLF
jgi:serine/threonine protein kinase